VSEWRNEAEKPEHWPWAPRCIADLKKIDDQPICKKDTAMDENRISGTAKNIGGKIEEGAGAVVGSAKTQLQGKLDQAAGTAQDLYGQAADTARESAAGFDKWLRTTIETQPYTAAVAALGIGWLLGRLHRPL
jgi:uncharacterized protein YjbJ (UPF0337 family)